MRVPGNERAFTVSPARGIPFPQLVCIGASGGQSQAFPVPGWAWPPAALRESARAPPRAAVRGPGRDSAAAPCSRALGGPRALPRLPGARPGRGAQLAGQPRARGVGLRGSGAAPGPGDPETGVERALGLGGRELRPQKPRAWGPAGGSPLRPGLCAQLPWRGSGTALAPRSAPPPAVHCGPGPGPLAGHRAPHAEPRRPGAGIRPPGGRRAGGPAGRVPAPPRAWLTAEAKWHPLLNAASRCSAAVLGSKHLLLGEVALVRVFPLRLGCGLITQRAAS